jgi:sortase B
MIVAIGVMCYAGYQLYSIWQEYEIGTKEYDGLAEIAKENGIDGLPKKSKGKSDKNIDYQALYKKMKAINSDYIGWLYVNDTINYPVVQASDNDYYLRRTFEGVWNKAGTLFMDASITEQWDAKNPIIYGHNLLNEKMFGTLDDYAEQSYYKEHPKFAVYLEDGPVMYEIFSAYKTQPETKTYQFEFQDDADFQEYLDYVIGKSYYDTGVTVDVSDSVILLSTCTNVNDGRFVLHAKKLE